MSVVPKLDITMGRAYLNCVRFHYLAFFAGSFIQQFALFFRKLIQYDGVGTLHQVQQQRIRQISIEFNADPILGTHIKRGAHRLIPFL